MEGTEEETLDFVCSCCILVFSFYSRLFSDFDRGTSSTGLAWVGLQPTDAD